MAHAIPIFINRSKFELTSPQQTGSTLKALAGLPPGDALYLEDGKEDLLIRDADTITVRPGSHFYSQPPADYGEPVERLVDLGVDAEVSTRLEPDGSTVIIVEGFRLPQGYSPEVVRLLLRVPALFPETRPDMFWVSPPVRTSSGGLPTGTGDESIQGEVWQRFSWHLKEGAWDPRQHSMRDFMRCVRARLERGN